MAGVLGGKVNSVVLTGNLCKANTVMAEIRRRVTFIAPLLIFKGEDELKALAAGDILVINQDEALKEY